MTKINFGGDDLEMKVAEDCVVIAGRFCWKVENLGLLIQEVKATGKTKLVIVGDCPDHEAQDGAKVIPALNAVGIECKWLPGYYYNIYSAIPDFSSTNINTFAEAENFGKMRRLLDKMGERVYEIKRKIRDESTLLADYPVVAEVQAIESHDHNDGRYRLVGARVFNTLFGESVPNKLVSSVNAVMLFNPANNAGVLVTKSQAIEFSLAAPNRFDLNILQGRGGKGDSRCAGYTKNNIGSIRINVGEGSPELSLYCNPGVWTVKPHPELDTTDLDIHYVPMWQRVEKAK